MLQHLKIFIMNCLVLMLCLLSEPTSIIRNVNNLIIIKSVQIFILIVDGSDQMQIAAFDILYHWQSFRTDCLIERHKRMRLVNGRDLFDILGHGLFHEVFDPFQHARLHLELMLPLTGQPEFFYLLKKVRPPVFLTRIHTIKLHINMCRILLNICGLRRLNYLFLLFFLSLSLSHHHYICIRS